MTIDKDSQQQPGTDSEEPALSFWALLYRFLFFDWLFRDVSSTRTLLERHAARQHNRRMSRYLPVYLRRWSFLTAFDFALGMLLEKVLQAGLLSALCVPVLAGALEQRSGVHDARQPRYAAHRPASANDTVQAILTPDLTGGIHFVRRAPVERSPEPLPLVALT